MPFKRPVGFMPFCRVPLYLENKERRKVREEKRVFMFSMWESGHRSKASF